MFRLRQVPPLAVQGAERGGGGLCRFTACRQVGTSGARMSAVQVQVGPWRSKGLGDLALAGSRATSGDSGPTAQRLSDFSNANAGAR